jgi:hypothetical protein
MTASAQQDGVQELQKVLGAWKPSNPADWRQLADRSLQEVVHLTEYQDEKANRILTAIAFLSAFAGALFLGFTQYQPPGLVSGARGGATSITHWRLVTLSYVLMLLYCLLLSVGCTLVLWAIKTRFNIPAGWKNTSGKPTSYLFFEKILDVSPKAWGEAFTSPVSSVDLEQEYLRSAVLETYLVAQKLRDKLWFLQPGLLALWLSTVILGIWLMIGLPVLMFFGKVE